MADDDDDLFRQQMSDIRPIKSVDRVAIKREDVSALAQQAARQAAVTTPERDLNPLAVGHVKLLDPHYPLEFKRSGVQNGVFRRLKQGKYSQEARLDLHKMTVDQARQEVYGFIQLSIQYGLRTVVIVHGKGNHSLRNEGQRNQSHSISGQGNQTQNPVALLKSYINHWLPELDEVQAYCSALPRDGGVGAVYVMLRKSEQKKQENRDRINRGRTVVGN